MRKRRDLGGEEALEEGRETGAAVLVHEPAAVLRLPVAADVADDRHRDPGVVDRLGESADDGVGLVDGRRPLEVPVHLALAALEVAVDARAVGGCEFELQAISEPDVPAPVDGPALLVDLGCARLGVVGLEGLELRDLVTEGHLVRVVHEVREAEVRARRDADTGVPRLDPVGAPDPEPGVAGLRERTQEHEPVLALARGNDEDGATLVVAPDRLLPGRDLAATVGRDDLAAGDPTEAELGADRGDAPVVGDDLPALAVDLVERDLADPHRARVGALREPGKKCSELVELLNGHHTPAAPLFLKRQSVRRTPPETDLRRDWCPGSSQAASSLQARTWADHADYIILRQDEDF